ncbi:MAG: CDP-diacylglycerol--glycerol-3-phosphate 3-phosphatidyltransferase [Caulobacteraceae bacterium]
MSRLPNLLTSLRLVLALFTFFGLAGAALLSDKLTPASQFALERWAVYAFVVAAVTDFFDGWLARRLNAVSLWGSVLDPIADKVLVCGAILGLLSLAPNAAVAIPAALILFREFTVSALREVAGRKGVTLPVTLIAKWKTTLQLVALAAQLVVACWGAFGLSSDPEVLGPATTGALVLLWLAAAVTLISGAQYWMQARHALGGDHAPVSSDLVAEKPSPPVAG